MKWNFLWFLRRQDEIKHLLITNYDFYFGKIFKNCEFIIHLIHMIVENLAISKNCFEVKNQYFQVPGNIMSFLFVCFMSTSHNLLFLLEKKKAEVQICQITYLNTYKESEIQTHGCLTSSRISLFSTFLLYNLIKEFFLEVMFLYLLGKKTLKRQLLLTISVMFLFEN